MRKYKQKNLFTEKASKLFENRITDLYDLYITHKTQLSCLTVDFTPEKIHRGEYQSQKLILGQCWNSSSPKIRPSLLVIDLNLSYPQNDKIINDWSENSQSSLINTDIHGWIETIVKIPHEGDVNIARCCPQKSQIIATKTSGGYVNLYDYRFFPSTPEVNSCCKPQMRLEGHGKTDGYALSWNSKNEGIIVSGSYDGLVCVWDISSGGGAKNTVQSHSNYRCHLGCVEDVSWFPHNDNIFCSVGDDGLFVIYDSRENKGVTILDLQCGELNSISMSNHNDTLLAFGSSSGIVTFLDLRKLQQPILSYKSNDASIKQISFSPLQKDLLACCGDDGIINVYNPSRCNSKDKNVTKFSFSNGGYISPINEFAWSPTDPLVIASAGILENCIWRLAKNSISF